MLSETLDGNFHDATLRRKLGTPLAEIGDARGKLTVWAPKRRGFVVSTGVGYGSVEFVAPFLRVVDAAIAEGAREIWDDWARIVSYDSAARVDIMRWMKVHPTIAPDVHVLVGSKLIAMGVTVANLALGNVMQVTSDRAEFERAVLSRL